MSSRRRCRHSASDESAPRAVSIAPTSASRLTKRARNRSMIKARSIPRAALTISDAKRRCKALLGSLFHQYENHSGRHDDALKDIDKHTRSHMDRRREAEVG